MEEAIRKLEVSWSYEAEIQYYDTLLFWIAAKIGRASCRARV